MLRKTAHAAESTQSAEVLFTSCQQLMGISLMSHIPDQLVIREIHTQMQCHGQFYNAEIGCQMAAMFTDRLYNKRPYL